MLVLPASLISSIFALLPVPSELNRNPPEMAAIFEDGTVLSKATVQQDLEVLTQNGKVSVSARDIQQVLFALRLPKDTADKIAQAVGRLGSTKFGEREAASKELVMFGYRAYPALQAAAKKDNFEVTKRAAQALKTIVECTMPTLLERNDFDIVVSRRGDVIKGRIQNSAIRLRTPSIGEVSIRPSQLLSFDAMSHKQVSLAASTFGQPIRWHDTGILVGRDTGWRSRLTDKLFILVCLACSWKPGRTARPLIGPMAIAISPVRSSARLVRATIISLLASNSKEQPG